MIQGLHHIALWARDFDRSVGFYTDVLGLVPAYQFDKPEGRVMILRTPGGSGAGHVEIFERPEQDDSPAEARLIHFALATDQVDAMHQQALNAGMIEKMAPKDVLNPSQIPGQPDMDVRLSFFLGPDGEVVELFHDKSV